MRILDQYGREIQMRNSLAPADEWLIDALGGSKSAAGERVNTSTAMTVMAFFACVRNIAEDLAKLPKSVIQQSGQRITRLPSHPVSRLLRSPSKFLDRHTFWLTYFSHALSRDGAYAYIVRENGVPVELLLLDPDHCKSFASEITGEPMFRVYGRTLFGWEVLHVHGLGDTGIAGFPATVVMKQVLGAAIAMQKMRGSFFGNGMMPSGILKHPGSLSDESKIALARNFAETYGGSDNAGAIVLLDEGFEFQAMSIDPDKADFSTLNEIGVIDICRFFRMPPHKIQDLTNAHYANVEEGGIDYKADTIDPWADRFRAQCDFKLLTLRETEDGVTVDVNLKGLERGNMQARKDFYNFMYYSGAYNANRILELEHENPVPNGDRYFVQANLVPADKVDAMLEKGTTSTPSGPAGPAPQPSQPTPSDGLRRMLAAKINDLLREELRQIESTGNKRKDWADWYRKRASTVCAHIAPYIDIIAEEMGAVCAVPLVAAESAAVLCRDGQALREAGLFDDWKSGQRGIDFAAYIITKLEECQGENAA